jgi:hypothetical protein
MKMSITDVANKSGEAAVEKALRDMRPDKNYAPKDRQSLSQLILEMEHLNKELGERLANAKHVLSLILGGLK